MSICHADIDLKELNSYGSSLNKNIYGNTRHIHHQKTKQLSNGIRQKGDNSYGLETFRPIPGYLVICETFIKLNDCSAAKVDYFVIIYVDMHSAQD